MAQGTGLRHGGASLECLICVPQGCFGANMHFKTRYKWRKN
jgi:hypothetical protein